MSGLNKILLAVMVGVAGWSAWGDYHQKLFPLRPLYPKPYIVLYGREACGNCQALRRDLDSRRMPYVWKIIDTEPGRTEAFSRMKQAGMGTGNFTLPLVDVNAEMMVHPDFPTVYAKYRL